MANSYLTQHYKGKWRILPVIDLETNDFPRNANGEIEDDLEVYIDCYNGIKVEAWGLNESRRTVLQAYIPSIGRGRNIKRAMKKAKINFFDYDESDEEVMFRFLASDVELVMPFLKPKTNGASISPTSTRNLPKAKVSIPKEQIEAYKAVTASIGKSDMLFIKNANQEFLDTVLAKRLKKKGRGQKNFDYRADMKILMMSRMTKEYIYTKGLWQEYLEFLDKEIEKYCKSKKS